MSFVPGMQDLIFGVLKVMFVRSCFSQLSRSIDSLLHWKWQKISSLLALMVSLNSSILDYIFWPLFLTLISVVSRTQYFLLWKYKADWSITFLALSTNVGSDIGNKLKKSQDQRSGFTSTGIKPLSANTFEAAGAGFGAGMMMNKVTSKKMLVLSLPIKEAPTWWSAPNRSETNKSRNIQQFWRLNQLRKKPPTLMESPITVEPTQVQRGIPNS